MNFGLLFRLKNLIEAIVTKAGTASTPGFIEARIDAMANVVSPDLSVILEVNSYGYVWRFYLGELGAWWVYVLSNDTDSEGRPVYGAYKSDIPDNWQKTARRVVLKGSEGKSTDDALINMLVREIPLLVK